MMLLPAAAAHGRGAAGGRARPPPPDAARPTQKPADGDLLPPGRPPAAAADAARATRWRRRRRAPRATARHRGQHRRDADAVEPLQRRRSDLATASCWMREPRALHPGLCSGCAHQRVISNTRGSVFSLCERGLPGEPGYAKYPRLPVLRCAGFEPTSAGGPASPAPRDGGSRGA